MTRFICLPLSLLPAAMMLALSACGDDIARAPQPRDPETVTRVTIDRFSAAAGHLMVRDTQNNLPAAGAPIDFDQGPFVTQGLSPDGAVVRYYNFDVQSDVPAPIYVFFREGATAPLPGQLNVVDVMPGEAGYSDFWQVTKVTVPDDYVANTITSVVEIQAAGLATKTTSTLVNCPIVPEGSSAAHRLGGGSTGLQRGWFRGMVVFYFSFEEAPLVAEAGRVPISPIFVTFNVNPDQPGGGPASGFMTEADGTQTHNVVGSVPSPAGGYSPLWSVQVYDNADFEAVHDFSTVSGASLLAENVALVNCPIAEKP